MTNDSTRRASRASKPPDDPAADARTADAAIRAADAASTAPRAPLPDRETVPVPSSLTDGAALADAICEHLRTYVAFPLVEHVDALALWVMHTYVTEIAEFTPYVHVIADTASGKSTLLDMLRSLTRQSFHFASPTNTAIINVAHMGSVTILIDELDSLFGRRAMSQSAEDLRTALNVGYQRGIPIPRGVPGGGIVFYEPFCPKVLAGITALPETLDNRCIPIYLLPVRKNEAGLSRHTRRNYGKRAVTLSSALDMWAEDARGKLVDVEPVMTIALKHDRALEIWEPLIAIADTLNEDWAARARNAAVVLNGDGDKGKPITTAQLFEMVVRAAFRRGFVAVNNFQTGKAPVPYDMNLGIRSADFGYDDRGDPGRGAYLAGALQIAPTKRYAAIHIDPKNWAEFYRAVSKEARANGEIIPDHNSILTVMARDAETGRMNLRGHNGLKREGKVNSSDTKSRGIYVFDVSAWVWNGEDD